MEELALVLLALILVMAVVLAVMRGRAAAPRAGGRKPRGASGARRAPARTMSYHLAPKNPDVMAGMLFELLAARLNFNEMTAFADLIGSPAMTERYLERLASGSNPEFADQVAFLCRAMQVHGYSDDERMRVSEAIAARARKERKLLEIQKNLDKIF